jgi:CRISPR-associated protein Csd1
MIVSSLVQRYEDTLDVPIGWKPRKVSYALEISEDGTLQNIIQLGDHSKKKPGSLALILPSEGSGRSSTKAYETAYYLCDNGKYMLGLDPKYFESARKLHLSLLDGADTPAARAIKAYFMQSIPSIPSGSD